MKRNSVLTWRHDVGPAHFLEVTKGLPLLIRPGHGLPFFRVVAYSLSGFGYSETLNKPSFGISKFAEVGHRVMLSLGYSKYGELNVQGISLSPENP